jgi:flagellin-like protein
MMTIMGKRFTNRGISTIIAALLLIAIAIAAGVLLYVFSIGLMGNLQVNGGQQTKDQVILEAYQWTTPTPLILNLRNTGGMTHDLTKANYYVGGVQMAAPTHTGTTCTPTAFSPGMACTATVPIASLTPTRAVAYVVKIGLADGGMVSYSAVYGNSMLTRISFSKGDDSTLTRISFGKGDNFTLTKSVLLRLPFDLS